MEVAVPVNPSDHFDFNQSAYANAPSTPRFMGSDFFSAPNSPTRTPDLHNHFHHFDDDDDLLISEPETYSLATVPFAWELKPGVPKSNNHFVDDPDFAFHVSSEQLHGDVIKPSAELEQLEQPQPPPPAAAAVAYKERERGRERTPSSRSRRTRSLPPAPPTTAPAPASSAITTLSVFGSRKWSFKDLFLFRSASDGRAMDKDPLKRYSSIFRKHDEDFRNSTLRDRSGSGSGSGSRRRGPRLSAHELHYTVNRAVSNDMKKQTFLPYKQGILGRLAFNPTVHALSNGFGNSHNN